MFTRWGHHLAITFISFNLAPPPKLIDDHPGFYAICLWTSIYQPYEHFIERNDRNLSPLIQSVDHQLYSYIKFNSFFVRRFFSWNVDWIAVMDYFWVFRIIKISHCKSIILIYIFSKHSWLKIYHKRFFFFSPIHFINGSLKTRIQI